MLERRELEGVEGEMDWCSKSPWLAWRIPGTGEPGGLPSMGLHRVRHDWSDLAAAALNVISFLKGQLYWQTLAPAFTLIHYWQDRLFVTYFFVVVEYYFRETTLSTGVRNHLSQKYLLFKLSRIGRNEECTLIGASTQVITFNLYTNALNYIWFPILTIYKLSQGVFKPNSAFSIAFLFIW